MQKNILCFGDSNTWGFIPGKLDYKTFYMERYDLNTRYTGVLQQLLGDEYRIIEEGLNGRTTNVDYKLQSGRNGATYLPPCLYSHSPLDLVTIFLGVNDMKAEFNRSAEAVAAGIEKLSRIVARSMFGADMQSPPKLLLIGYPIPVNEDYPDLDGSLIFDGAIERMKALAPMVQKIAEKIGADYLDCTDVPLSDIDGIHLEEAGHRQIAERLAKKITSFNWI